MGVWRSIPSPPLWQDLRRYRREDLAGDLKAGGTLGVLLIPQAMAYALIAGLPAIYGLYAAILPMLVYAVFGTSRHLTMGPAALIALLVATGVGLVAEPGTADYTAWAISLSFGVGAVLFLLGVFRLGYLVNFLSAPVISGFTAAAALLIVFSQIRGLTGMTLPSTRHVQEVLEGLVQHADTTHVPTALVGGVTILLLEALRRWAPALPAALLVVVAGILVAAFSGLPDRGLAVLGTVPHGLPSPSLPRTDPETWRLLLPAVLSIAIMGYVQSFAVAKAVQTRAKSYRLDANQELLAQGLANLAGAFGQAFPSAGSLSRTAVAYESGGRTGLASVFGAGVVVLTLLFLTPLLRTLPIAVLSAVIVVASVRLISWRDARHLWHTDRRDFAMWTVTFLATLTMGIETGILAGVVLSLSMVIYSSSRPHYAVLGRLSGTTIYKNVQRFPEAEEEEGVLIIRLDARLYFANQQYVREAFERELAARPETELFIVDAASISMVDSSAIAMLQELRRQFLARGVALRFLGLIGPVRDAFRKNGMHGAIGPDHVYMRIHDAVEQFRAEQDGRAWAGPPGLRVRGRGPMPGEGPSAEGPVDPVRATP